MEKGKVRALEILVNLIEIRLTLQICKSLTDDPEVPILAFFGENINHVKRSHFFLFYFLNHSKSYEIRFAELVKNIKTFSSYILYTMIITHFRSFCIVS